MTPCFQVDLMMDSVKQDLKIEDEEKQEEQYEKDMKLQVVKSKQEQTLLLILNSSTLHFQHRIDI